MGWSVGRSKPVDLARRQGGSAARPLAFQTLDRNGRLPLGIHRRYREEWAFLGDSGKRPEELSGIADLPAKGRRRGPTLADALYGEGRQGRPPHPSPPENPVSSSARLAGS